MVIKGDLADGFTINPLYIDGGLSFFSWEDGLLTRVIFQLATFENPESISLGQVLNTAG